MASATHFDDQASSARFVVVYPDGIDGCWNVTGGNPNTDDVGFINGLLDRLIRDFSVDQSRIFIAGVSGGAALAYRLACELSNRIAAIASVAGAMTGDCRPARAVSVLEMHGTEDCWAGGCPRPELLGVDALNQRWRTIDGCAGDPLISQSGITNTSVWRCKGGSMVRLDTVVGGHHTWFGCTSPGCDPVPGEPKATDVVWAFFNQLASTK